MSFFLTLFMTQNIYFLDGAEIELLPLRTGPRGKTWVLVYNSLLLSFYFDPGLERNISAIIADFVILNFIVHIISLFLVECPSPSIVRRSFSLKLFQ